MSKKKEYKGERRGDVHLAEQSLFAANGINDDELVEILDYQIDPESAVLWCQRQDARKFKREKCVQKGALIFSLPVEGEEKPRYFALEVIKQERPEDRQVIRKRVIKALVAHIATLIEIESIDDANGAIFKLEDEILEIVREILRDALRDKESKKSA